MAEILRINQMGNQGLNSDTAPWELPLGYITYGHNFRSKFGKMYPFSGSYAMLSAPENNTGYGFLTRIRNSISDYWVQASRSDVYIVDIRVNKWVRISEMDYDLLEGGEFDWNATQLGQYLIMNNPGSYPEYYLDIPDNDDRNHLEELPFMPNPLYDPEFPDNILDPQPQFLTWKKLGQGCKIMRSHKDFLIALNLTGDDPAPNGYRISHPADINGLPFTWDERDTSGIAIKATLGGDGGEIVDGLTLRDSFFIYSRSSLDYLVYNSNSEFYWERKELSSTAGLLRSNCLVEVKGSHFFLSEGDMVMNNGNDITSIIYNKLLRRFNANTSEDTSKTSFVVKHDLAKEIWFCVPEDSSPTPNMAYVYNWKEDTWNLRDLPYNTVSASYGHLVSLNDQWGVASGTWASDNNTWGITRTYNEILGANDSTGKLMDLDTNSDINEEALNCVIERTDFPLADHRGNNMIIRAYPSAEGDPFIMQFGSQQQAGGPVNWESEQVFTPGVTRKLDFRSTGELLCYRIKSIDKNRFKISGMQIEYVPSGVR